MRASPVGAEWRRWDLHFHTPSSFDYRGPRNTTAEELVRALVTRGISVVAVTDHHRIDTDLVRDMRLAAGDELTVFPGMELRTELGGTDKIHMIAAFPESADLEDLWTSIQVKLRLQPRAVAERGGDDAIWVPFEEACREAHELGGFVIVHAGRKSNSLDTCLPSRVHINQIIKRELVEEHVDAFEVSRPGDAGAYTEIIFPAIGREYPIVIGSDCHDLRTGQVAERATWIKADPTFLGLRQAAAEPVRRVFLGAEPPQLLRIRGHATKYMSGVAFEKTSSGVAGEWFSGRLPLNAGLVAVIGNEGSGKSALADILALLGDTAAVEHFAFLDRGHFLRPRDGLAGAFEATLRWASGEAATKRLDASVDSWLPERVKYVPQSYLETLCASVNEPGVSAFEREVEEVIFSHVVGPERLGTSTLGELIAHLTSDTEERIRQLQRELGLVNSDILETEGRLTPAHRSSLEAELSQRAAELEVLDAARPPAVASPTEDAGALGRIRDAK